MRDGSPAQRLARENTVQSRVTRILAVAPFEEWTYEQAHQALRDILPTDYTVTERYCVDKDHFQEGSQWVGPGTPTTNSKIGEQFAPEDAIGEVLSNVENAFTDIQLTVIGEDDTLVEEATDLLKNWWRSQKMQEHVQERQRTAAWAGWGALRLWVPWRYLATGESGSITVIPASDVEQGMKYIHAMAPAPENCGIVIDADTMEMAAIYLDEEIEYLPNGQQNRYPRAELMYLDPNRVPESQAATIVRTVYGNEAKPGKRVALDLNGHLLTTELRTRSLITEPVLRTQRQLNLLTSLLTRIAETAAFRERYTTNAQPQGRRIPYEDGDTLVDGAFIQRDEEGRAWQVIPQARTLGAGTTTELVGLPRMGNTGDANGHESPGVVIADPVDPGPYTLAADTVRRKILRMCGQGHLGGASNAESSGIAYEQARAVFEKDLEKRKIAEEHMLAELLTAALRFGEQIAGTPGLYTDSVRINVTQHINPGPRSPDLVRLDLEAYEAGALSLPTVQSRMGVEDTDAEAELIRKSAGFVLKVIEGMGALQSYTPESMLNMMREMGIPDNLVNSLEPKDEPEPPIGAVAGNIAQTGFIED